MKLTETEARALALEINEKNCAICVNGIKFQSVSFSSNVTEKKVRYLCSKGLQFPKCRSEKIRGFRTVD